MRRTASIVAAPLEEEIAPFLERIGARPELREDALVTYRGVLGGQDVVAAVIGDGAGRSGRGLSRLLEETVPQSLLLIGVAGGLSPDLDVGSLVQVRTVVSRQGDRRELDPDLSGLADSTILSADTIASSIAEKAKLWEEICRPERAVVDLESWTVVKRLEETGCRLAIVRAVSDAAHEALPLDFAALSDEEGHVVRARVLWRLMRHPSALKGVLEMRRRVLECAERLGAVAERWVVVRQCN